jgi:hypothetical protein
VPEVFHYSSGNDTLSTIRSTQSQNVKSSPLYRHNNWPNEKRDKQRLPIFSQLSLGVIERNNALDPAA